MGMVPLTGDLPPKKEFSYNVSKFRRKRGDKWSGKPTLRSKSSKKRQKNVTFLPWCNKIVFRYL